MKLKIPFLLLIAVFLTACVLPMPDEKEATNVPATAILEEAPKATASPEIENLPDNDPSATPTRVENDPASPTMQASPTLTATIVPPVKRSATTSETNEPQFVLQTGSPVAAVNFVEPTAGCNFSGIAGQVFDTNQNPVLQIVVEVTGIIQGNNALFIGLTGSDKDIGAGGYVIKLANQPFASDDQLQIQLKNLEGQPLSDSIPFDTYNDCEKNLIVMNFVPSSTVNEVHLPLIQR